MTRHSVPIGRRGVAARARELLAKTIRSGAFTTSLILVLLLFMATASAAGLPTGAAEGAAVGLHALHLPGIRPGLLDRSGYIRVPFSPGLNPSGGEMTIEACVSRAGTGRRETIVGNGLTTSYWFGFNNNDKVIFSPAGIAFGVESDSVVLARGWTHVAVTYDGYTRRFYINGVLDKTSTLNPKPIAPADGTPLGIGFDHEDLITPNYFGGLIDNLRIWNVVRSPSQIRDGVFTYFGTSRPGLMCPGLMAEWTFDGDASDPVGGHDGTPIGVVEYTNEGAIPHDIRVPQVSVTPTLDGFCRTTEYANAMQVTLDGTGALLMHTEADMWICLEDLESKTSSAVVYLDADHTRLDPL